MINLRFKDFKDFLKNLFFLYYHAINLIIVNSFLNEKLDSNQIIKMNYLFLKILN